VKISELYPDAELIILTQDEEIEVMIENKSIKILPTWKWCLLNS
jgi:predicted AAA+ superfamily ATPase